MHLLNLFLGRYLFALLKACKNSIQQHDLGFAQVFRWAELLSDPSSNANFIIVPESVLSHNAKHTTKLPAKDKHTADIPAAAVVSDDVEMHDEDQPEPKKGSYQVWSAGVAPAAPITTVPKLGDADPKEWLTYDRKVRSLFQIGAMIIFPTGSSGARGNCT